MLTRRHIRVKVLQSLYAFFQGEETDLDKQEKFLAYSIAQMRDLEALMLQLFVAMRDQAELYLQKSQQKHLATQEERNPSRAFIDNKVIALLAGDPELQGYFKNRKNSNLWKDNDEYPAMLFKELRQTSWYESYLELGAPDFAQDLDLVIKMYKEVVAPNEKLYDYLEDHQLTWADDYPLINTAVVKMLAKMSPKRRNYYSADIYKNEEDQEFSLQLLRKVILNDDSLADEIDAKTPNWDKERIADLDMIILKMGIAEFRYFPSIPVKVSINEYLEISKEYSTPKSSLFINGILDKLVKELKADNKLNKIGRGLQ